MLYIIILIWEVEVSGLLRIYYRGFIEREKNVRLDIEVNKNVLKKNKNNLR